MNENQKLAGVETIDPLVASLTARKVEQDAATFTAILDSRGTEHTVHQFLANHSYFFNGILRLLGRSPLYSKVKLGSDYEVDFAWVDTGSFGPEWCLVEIESPKATLFTKSGNPSVALTHAMQQVSDWNAWIHDHLEYAQKLMPQIVYPLAYIFLGRRDQLTPSSKRKLRDLARQNRNVFELHTLDFFAGAARSVISLMDRNGSGSWSVPMRALGDSDLKKGLPAPVLEWTQGHASNATIERNLRHRKDHRKDSYLRLSEFTEDCGGDGEVEAGVPTF